MKVYIVSAFSLNMVQASHLDVRFKKLSASECREMIKEESRAIVHAVGHPDIATIASQMGVDVKCARENVLLEKEDEMYIVQYRGPRLEPGTTKLPEGAKIEFWWALVGEKVYKD